MRRGGIEKGMRRKELKEGLEGEDLNGERKRNEERVVEKNRKGNT